MSNIPAVVCPRCQSSFQGEEDLIGQTIQCPTCNKTFVFEGAADTQFANALAAGPAGGEVPETFGFADKEEPVATKAVADDEGAYGVTNVDLRARCPHCAHVLEAENAVICLECGYNLQTRQRLKTKKVFKTTATDKVSHIVPGIVATILVGFFALLGLFYCLAMPDDWCKLSLGFFTIYLDHESLRMWLTIIMVAVIWALGIFAYQRLLMNPAPDEIERKSKRGEGKLTATG